MPEKIKRRFSHGQSLLIKDKVSQRGMKVWISPWTAVSHKVKGDSQNRNERSATYSPTH